MQEGIEHSPQASTSWPTSDQELLLGAVLWQGEKAPHAWQAWQAKIDWNDHLDPDSYRLMPLLFHNLSQYNVEDPIMQKLKGIYRMVWYKNHIAFYRLASLLHTFHEAEIRTMIVKGTALTVAHYPNSGLRPLSEFDLLVPIAQAADAIVLLQRSDWKLDPWLTSRPIGILLATRPTLVFTDATQQRLNLHWRVLHESSGADADESFWQAAIATEIDGVPTSILSPTDQLLQVCVDGGPSSGETSIGWIADAMMVLKAPPSAIDWQRLLTHAQERLLVLPLREALTYLHDVFAAPIPVSIVHKLCSKSTSRMERWEARYLTSGYRHRPLGDIPFFWFDYLRSRKLLANENKLWGFVQYLQRRAEVPHLWQLPLSLLGACGRRVRRALKSEE